MTTLSIAEVSWERMTNGVVKVRERLTRAAAALETAGVPYAVIGAGGVDGFLDGPTGKARDAVHVVFAGERVRPEYPLPAPDVRKAERAASFRLLLLEELVVMKLTSFRDKDRVHLRDLADVGLLDSSWPQRLSSDLAPRLRAILESPEG